MRRLLRGDLNRLEFWRMHDPVSAIVFGQSVNVDYTVVGGKFIVKEGSVVTVDERKLIEKHNKAAKRCLLIKVKALATCDSLKYGCIRMPLHVPTRKHRFKARP